MSLLPGMISDPEVRNNFFKDSFRFNGGEACKIRALHGVGHTAFVRIFPARAWPAADISSDDLMIHRVDRLVTVQLFIAGPEYTQGLFLKSNRNVHDTAVEADITIAVPGEFYYFLHACFAYQYPAV